MTKAILMAVHEHPRELAAIQRELLARYAADYEVIAEASATAAVKALVLTSMFVPGPLTEDLRRLIRQRRRRGEASRTRADQCQLSYSGCVLICSLGLSTPGVTS